MVGKVVPDVVPCVVGGVVVPNVVWLAVVCVVSEGVLTEDGGAGGGGVVLSVVP